MAGNAVSEVVSLIAKDIPYCDVPDASSCTVGEFAHCRSALLVLVSKVWYYRCCLSSMDGYFTPAVSLL
ncbi:Peptidase S41 family protein ustP [Fusarium oxysporum f. sp. albedinis]|nr:Peptidase S41 family protein ustP [Fusarium oxysporum f. sp. albedinis]